MSSDASPTGWTDDEAKEFHGLFVTGFIGFTVIALIAHFLVWMWRPWFPGPDGYAMVEKAQSVAASFIPYLT